MVITKKYKQFQTTKYPQTYSEKSFFINRIVARKFAINL